MSDTTCACCGERVEFDPPPPLIGPTCACEQARCARPRPRCWHHRFESDAAYDEWRVAWVDEFGEIGGGYDVDPMMESKIRSAMEAHGVLGEGHEGLAPPEKWF